MSKKRRQRLFFDMHPVHRAIVFLMALLIIWVAGSAAYGMIQRQFIETVTIESETNDIVLEGYGFVHTDTAVISSQKDGEFSGKVKSGERVAKNELIGVLTYDNGDKKKQKEVLAPKAGIITYHTDGYEKYSDINQIKKLNLKEIYDAQKKNDPRNGTKKNVVSGERCAAVVDNLKPVMLFFPYDEGHNHIFSNPGDVFHIRFPDIGDDVVAYVLDIVKDDKGHAWGKLDLGPMSDGFLKERVVSAQAYRTEKAVLKLNKDALVFKEKKPGVYITRRGIITWQPISIQKEKNDKVICDMLPKDTTIIITPHLVREGDILK